MSDALVRSLNGPNFPVLTCRRRTSVSEFMALLERIGHPESNAAAELRICLITGLGRKHLTKRASYLEVNVFSRKSLPQRSILYPEPSIDNSPHSIIIFIDLSLREDFRASLLL